MKIEVEKYYITRNNLVCKITDKFWYGEKYIGTVYEQDGPDDYYFNGDGKVREARSEFDLVAALCTEEDFADRFDTLKQEIYKLTDRLELTLDHQRYVNGDISRRLDTIEQAAMESGCKVGLNGKPKEAVTTEGYITVNPCGDRRGQNLIDIITKKDSIGLESSLTDAFESASKMTKYKDIYKVKIICEMEKVN